jgi:PAS domain S-box-containing protein
MDWITGRSGWVVPLVAFLLVLGGTYMFAQGRQDQLDAARRDAAGLAERRASLLADELGNAINNRLGALTAAKLRFTAVEDSASERTFAAALDSVTAQLVGLTAVSVIHEDGRVAPGSGAVLGRGIALDQHGEVHDAYRRAVANRRPAASGVVDHALGRRVFVFNPVLSSDSVVVLGVLAAELDPQAVFRAAMSGTIADTVRGAFYALYGPRDVRITSVPTPTDWPTVDRPVRVADSEWTLRLSYPPVAEGAYHAQRWATMVTGVALALALAWTLFLLRRTIRSQREEIGLRRAAEDAARGSAAEARERAREARELTAQIEAAQRAAARLSTSLDPDAVVELFLGGVAEALRADVASLYTFEEEGEIVVGRKRMVFNETMPLAERIRGEDIRQVRAPVAMLPIISEAVATGEPQLVTDQQGPALPGSGPEGPVASVTLPLMVGGHMVGIASWEVYEEEREFERSDIAFAQALAAPAAAALRTAELFSSLEAARARAAQEAARFGTVLDQMADGVVVVDAAGHVQRSNKAAEELLGPEVHTLPAAQWTTGLEISHTDGRSYAVAEFPLVRALEGQHVRRTTLTTRNAQGVERFLSCSAAPIQAAGGEVRGAAMVFRDVTDEHQYAEMLRHTNRELRRQAEMLEEVNRQLREATKAKDQFLAVMSHELRTPINAILGYSDLLDMEIKGTLNSEQRVMLNRIRETSRHLLGLINEVLDLAKIGAGRVELDPQELEVEELVRRAAEQVLPLANAKGLVLVTERKSSGGGERRVGAAPAPLRIVADETRCAQILINLFSNAVKFTQQGKVVVRYGALDGRVQVRVRDTGPGIPQDEQERIFEEFYQVEGGLARSTGGTGLGLAIARRFARLMGGDILVWSRPGEGAEFTLDMPAAGYVEPEPEPDRQLRILALVERPQELATRLPQVAGVDTAWLGSPRRLAAKARRQPPDAVLLDVGLGNAVWQALTALQAGPRTARLPTVLVAPGMGDDGRVVGVGPFTFVAARRIRQERREAALAALLLGECVEGERHDGSVLLAGLDAELEAALSESLAGAGLDVRVAESGMEAVSMMCREPPDLCVLGLVMPAMDGLETVARMRAEPQLRRTRAVVVGDEALAAPERERLRRTVMTVPRDRGLAASSVPELLACLAEFLPANGAAGGAGSAGAGAPGAPAHGNGAAPGMRGRGGPAAGATGPADDRLKDPAAPASS